jgi:hypothetical protein
MTRYSIVEAEPWKVATGVNTIWSATMFQVPSDGTATEEPHAPNLRRICRELASMDVSGSAVASGASVTDTFWAVEAATSSATGLPTGIEKFSVVVTADTIVTF